MEWTNQEVILEIHEMLRLLLKGYIGDRRGSYHRWDLEEIKKLDILLNSDFLTRKSL